LIEVGLRAMGKALERILPWLVSVVQRWRPGGWILLLLQCRAYIGQRLLLLYCCVLLTQCLHWDRASLGCCVRGVVASSSDKFLAGVVFAVMFEGYPTWLARAWVWPSYSSLTGKNGRLCPQK
jgi:hypothetical protein